MDKEMLEQFVRLVHRLAHAQGREQFRNDRLTYKLWSSI